MDKKEQMEFVNDLCNNIRSRIIVDIADGKIPDNWDGIKLRLLIAERAQRAVLGYIAPSRKRSYKNIVLVRDL